MIVEHLRPGQAPAIYRRFRDHGRMMPERENDLGAWMANWADLIDFEIVPVRTSAEAAEAIAPQL